MSIAYIPKKSGRTFYVPPTLESDFDNFLNHDIPNVVMDFNLYHNWYDQLEEDYEEKIIRGEIYPNSTKSRYENMDNQLNFRASMSSGIVSGDIIKDKNGKIYLLDWEIEPEPNNASTRALVCNSMLTFSRYTEEQTDERGFVEVEEGYQTIARAIPCNIYRYDGRPEFSSYAGTAGVIPNALTISYVQYNPETDKIRIDDTFEYFNDTYVIIDIDYVGVNMNKTNGVVKIVSKKKAGGVL